ncbi:XrtA system polysaccharide deacetylase [Arsukibacterium sp. UBA3155]|uniref:XrtA system polysaccharide deacetylase n=1 Tax=Arsukibacterium sp. UBA3155 TaxID=1946058 RepID=UPI0025B9E916|nr:XrtA system polysaccharide deacetylase [Arsukibacterium sp. UBA3155]|tara:strand:+ start:7834 stop:8685 length:852 start_codon:yes stop_codon:yes gene_type:complete
MNKRSSVFSALTVDVEDYFHVAAFERTIAPADWDNMPARVQNNTRQLLDLFDTHQAKATFFMLGWVAERFPELVKDIHQRGHEVASHGYNHSKATSQSPAEFFQDVSRAKHLLEDITGSVVTGYRAPSFSIGKQNEWAFASLQQAGYQYSSSTYPVIHDLYGTPDWPQQPYLRKEGIWECPMPVLSMLGRQLPIAGGGYFRLLPYWLTRRLISRYLKQKNIPYMFYCHPWEIDPQQPRIAGAPLKSRFRHYVNLNRMETKIGCLLQDFNWRSVNEVYQPYFKR